MASRTLIPTRAKTPAQYVARRCREIACRCTVTKSLYLIKISILDLQGCSPIIGRLFSVEGNMSWRISSKTEMDRSIVTLKLSFSPLASLMKNDAKSRIRKKKSGTIRFMTYSIGFLSIVTCKTGRFIRPGHEIKSCPQKKTHHKNIFLPCI